MTKSNKQLHLVKRPQGIPTMENFNFVEAQVPQPQEGEILVRALYLSVDPYMRGRMSDAKSYAKPFSLNEMIKGRQVAEVVESKSKKFIVGDVIFGELSWQEYSTANENDVRKLSPEQAPVTTALGILGMPGLTAYFGLLDIGKPKENETVVVSGAAGAVGSAVGQIAKIKGARVVGIAGTEKKINYLINELGFDEAINYKTTPNIELALQKACPNGIDIYFDNVGGDIADAMLPLLNKFARIPLCGSISAYNAENEDIGPRVQKKLRIASALMQGFISSDYKDRFPEGSEQMLQWFQAGKLKYEETITDGFENIPQAFLGLFTGDNIGKQIVKIADPKYAKLN